MCWTCWAIPWRCRTATGWAPSCWPEPPPSASPSPTPRYFFWAQEEKKKLCQWKCEYNHTLLNLSNFLLPVEQNVGLRVLHHCLVDLRHVLVIKLVPLAINDVLAVSYVVSTCSRDQRQRRWTRIGLIRETTFVGQKWGEVVLPAVPWWQMTESRS